MRRRAVSEIDFQHRPTRASLHGGADAMQIAEKEAVDDVNRFLLAVPDDTDSDPRPLQHLLRQVQAPLQRAHAEDEPALGRRNLTAVLGALDQGVADLPAELVLDVQIPVQAGNAAGQDLSASPTKTGQQHFGRRKTPFVEGDQRQHGDPRSLLPLRTVRLDVPGHQLDSRLHLDEGYRQIPADGFLVGEL